MDLYKGNEYTGDLERLRPAVKVVRLDANWVVGHLHDDAQMIVQMQVFAEGSEHGIEGGRISALLIRNRNGSTRVHYDRGWDMKPESAWLELAVRKMVDALNGRK